MRSMLVVLGLAVIGAVAAAPPAAAAPARPDGAGHTFTTHGMKIWYAVRGSERGTPLVVVNGGPGFSHDYELCSDVWDRLAKRRPVVMYDQRGNGRSGAIEQGGSCTLVDQIADLEALRAQLGAQKMDLLGHSWGGFLAMAYAGRHPERVNRLIIVDSAAPKWASTEFMFANFFPERIAKQSRFDLQDRLGMEGAFQQSLDVYFSMLFYSDAKRDEFLSHAAGYRINRAVNEAISADVAAVDLTPLLHTFRMPTLVICGRYDFNVAPSTAWRIHQAIPGSRFEVFEHSGHLPFFEEPDAFMRVVEPFLDGR